MTNQCLPALAAAARSPAGAAAAGIFWWPRHRGSTAGHHSEPLLHREARGFLLITRIISILLIKVGTYSLALLLNRSFAIRQSLISICVVMLAFSCMVLHDWKFSLSSNVLCTNCKGALSLVLP
ncbi:uncharacterized protein [Lolium perenne]|uniref:uncharacterized protein isoform X2 n=1 Tax=Lolium perenne TaxID=4522 RepID=UPI003A9921BD